MRRRRGWRRWRFERVELVGCGFLLRGCGFQTAKDEVKTKECLLRVLLSGLVSRLEGYAGNFCNNSGGGIGDAVDVLRLY